MMNDELDGISSAGARSSSVKTSELRTSSVHIAFRLRMLALTEEKYEL